MIEHVLVGGIKVATASRAELCHMIVGDCVQGQPAPEGTRLLFDSNGHGISLAATNPAYRRALEAADVVHADGGFVVLASRYLAGAPVADRSATTDMIHDLANAGLNPGLTHYLLGGTEAVNAACAERLAELYPGIRIVGRRNGYWGRHEEAEVIADIAAHAPDLLWIGLGKPREQIFAATNRARLGARWAISCGGCFNFITGAYSRAPRWMQDAQLEWAYRAATSPRLLWRYAVTSPHAILLALSRASRRRVPGS
jgi:exopolysaccharide biosynthesis WecB/TagA/CpsF family protein